MTALNTAARRHRPDAHQDAIALLLADHAMVSQLFADYAKARSATGKMTLVTQICRLLTVHAQVKAEIFYPAVRDGLKGPWPMPGTSADEAQVWALIVQLRGAVPDGEPYDAQVARLSTCVAHRARQEQAGMFPWVLASTIDTFELGTRMAARRDDLWRRTA